MILGAAEPQKMRTPEEIEERRQRAVSLKIGKFPTQVNAEKNLLIEKFL